MSDPTILGLGAYAPDSFISSDTFADAWGHHEAAGIERCAVPDGDEDSLTLAWEAARRALTAAGRDPAAVAHLLFATTTPPIDEEDLVARLGSTLGVPADARHSYIVGSARAGTEALGAALDAGPWDERIGLVVAADIPRGRPDDAVGQAAGAGAGAVVLGRGGPGSVVDHRHHATAAPGERFRPPSEPASTGLGVTGYERAAYREAVLGATDQLAVDPDTVDAAAIAAPDGRRPYRIARDLGLDASTVSAGTTVHDLGVTAAADILLGIAGARAGGADRVLAVGYGAGAGADALLLELEGVPTATAIDPDSALDYPTYLRRRGELGGDEPAGGGAYVSLPTWRRSLPQRHRLEVGRCVDCEALALRPAGACRECGTTAGFEPVRLAGTGSVETVTTIAGGAPPEFEAYQTRAGPFQTAIVAFGGPDGGSVSIPAMVVGESVSMGDRVEAVLRRLYTQEGLPRYGLKVTGRP